MPGRVAGAAAKSALPSASGSKMKGSKSQSKGAKSSGDEDFVMTLDSDDEVPGEEEEALESEEEGEEAPSLKKQKAGLASRDKIKEPVKAKSNARGAGDGEMALDKGFTFDVMGDGFDMDINGAWDMSVKGAKGSGGLNGGHEQEQNKLSVDDIIEKRRRTRPDFKLPEPEEEDDDESEVHEESEMESDIANDAAVEEDEEDDEEFGTGVKKRAHQDAEDEESLDEEDPLSDSEAEEEEGDDEEEDEEDSEAEGEESEEENSDVESEEETEVEKARKAAFFAAEEQQTPAGAGKKEADETPTFQSLSLSRPLLRALATLNFHAPTPIQARSIPIALAGKDIVAGAVTGSGKTAAFMIPILERLAHRPKGRDEAKTRVIIMMPTRELAVQCASVGRALGKFLDVRFCLAVGGLSLKAQEAELKLRPDVVIATPGRLIDHMRNSASFGIEDVEIVVMDEADRMLEEGFSAELNEILEMTPKARQTMLFSATMTDDVDELVRLSMKRPVRLFVDPKRTTAKKLIQEFVRVRGQMGSGQDEGDSSQQGVVVVGSKKRTEDEARPALLLSLCTRTFRTKAIIFVRSKKLAHQLRIVFGLVGLSAGELHGDLTQEQRLQSLQAFKDGRTDFLIATDLASRGLDIRGVETVINYDMPTQFEQYLHRVGRTARAGRNGRAVTLVGQGDRKMLKMALKRSPAAQVKHRMIPGEVVSQISDRLDEIKGDVDVVLREEKEEKELRRAEMELTKGQNMVDHREEIMSRPKRTWFQSESEKHKQEKIGTQEYLNKVGGGDKDKKAGAAAKEGRDRFSGLSRKKKRMKMAKEEDAEMNKRGEIDAGIRAAKKAQRPKELGVLDSRSSKAKGKDKKGKKTRSSFNKVGKGAAGGFASDLGDRTGSAGARGAAKGKARQKGKVSKGANKGAKTGNKKGRR